MGIVNLGIAKRLGLSFGIMCFILLVLAVIAWKGLNMVQTGMSAAKERSERVSTALEMSEALQKLYATQGADMLCVNSAEKDANSAKMNNYSKIASQKLSELKNAINSDAGKKMLSQLEATIIKVKEDNKKGLEMAQDFQGGDALRVYNELFYSSLTHLDKALETYSTFLRQQAGEFEKRAEDTAASVRMMLVIASVVGLAFAVIFGFLITKSICKPLAEGVEILNLIAAGNLSNDVPESLMKRQDEFGDLSKALDVMVKNLRKVVRDVSGGAQSLLATSSALATISQNVASAADQASSNTTMVASSMEQTSASLSSVTDSTNEMTMTISDIASNSEKARAISMQADSKAKGLSESVQKFEQAAQEIGQITSTITKISSQTNLLALNATIEAARAGESGKGFAVVANEIKELARQTATATEDINNKISWVQDTASNSMKDITNIINVIDEVGQTVSSIAAAIEEQAAITKDVAANISQAFEGVKDANRQVAQLATVSQNIANDISGLSSQTGHGAESQASALRLSKLASDLNEVIKHFKV